MRRDLRNKLNEIRTRKILSLKSKRMSEIPTPVIEQVNEHIVNIDGLRVLIFMIEAIGEVNIPEVPETDTEKAKPARYGVGISLKGGQRHSLAYKTEGEMKAGLETLLEIWTSYHAKQITESK